ncbi:hypothetical protein BDK92_7138 [Micromonospora pisi]|uniref:Uncharacterized protein n=1 Tax=Micromonospora pisi TaxID=589240 RepID=A0A495JWD4_9ACTN|nr:hypothetical protein [Micromonospora pisi]RKR92662.1 hypothetical protein BDK92_7138 [Micromonospora pisi]
MPSISLTELVEHIETHLPTLRDIAGRVPDARVVRNEVGVFSIVDNVDHPDGPDYVGYVDLFVINEVRYFPDEPNTEDK